MMTQDRIYGWLDSQLSIARFYGGCKIQGIDYVIDMVIEGNPLVKASVLEAENKAARTLAKETKAANTKKNAEKQGALL